MKPETAPINEPTEFDLKSLKRPALRLILCYIAYLAGCLIYTLIR